MSESFKACVAAYCEIDDQLKTINKNIKELKTKQKEMADQIMEYMSSNSIEVCNAGNYGVLTLKSSMVKTTLNKDCLKENLCKFITESRERISSGGNPDELAENGAEYILNNRPTEVRNSLRRSSPKTS
jgi:hypothetical protein